MRKSAVILTAAICAAVLFAACAMPAGTRVSESAERVLSGMRSSYRSAELVVSGECVRTHIDGNGAECSDIEVDEVFSGAAETGGTLHCVSGGMEKGARYLLYLSAGDDVPHAEDVVSYSTAELGPVRISGADAVVDGVRVSLDYIREDMAELSLVINEPANTYYYNDLAALCQAADDIFIGYVRQVGELTDTCFRSSESGAMVERTISAAKADVTAFGSMKGALRYGESVELIYSPAMGSDVLDAQTLMPVPYGENAAPGLSAGNTYLFFLIDGPDAKQSARFSVNPMQGYARIDGETLVATYASGPMARFTRLTPAVEAIRAALGD